MTKKLIVTGASGFLGSHFLVENLRTRPRDFESITCLVRETLRAPAKERMLKAFETAIHNADHDDEIDHLKALFDEKCVVLSADIEKPNCGLSVDDRANLVADEMWHFAAMLRFSIKLRRYVTKSIVGGTQEVLKLAEDAGAKAFNYLSTAIVAGNQVGFNRETFHESLDGADTSYEMAKREAELVVRDRCNATGMAWRIFRPSIVVGHSVTHKGKTDTGFYGLVTICAKLKNEIESKIPDFLSQHPIKLANTSDDSAMNLIYVDDAVDQMIEIAANPESFGHIFHIVNKEQVAQSDMLEEMQDVLDIRINRVKSTDEFEPLDHLVRKQMGEYEKYFNNRYEFDTVNADKFLSGLSRKAISRADARHLMEEYYDHFQREDSRANLFESPIDDFDRRSIETERGELVYYVGGQGSIPVVIINAYGQSLHFWTELFSLMRADYRIYLWEIRGTSVVAGGMQGCFSVEDHIRDALRLIDTEALQRCNLMGWCTGGKIALEVASRAPERIARVVCLTPSFKGTAGENLDTQYEKSMEPICHAVDRMPEQAKLVQEFMGSFFGGVDSKDDTRGGDLGKNVTNVLSMVNRNVRPLLVAPFVAESSILNYARQLLEFWAHDISYLYDKVEVPIMVLSGERDEIADPKLAHKVIKKFPNSIGFQIIGGSHYIHKDNSHSVKRMLDAFVERELDAIPESERVEAVA
jgi:thioester reductase-like protein/pimeloyl-ACP methyl ester carboxylesterase